MPTQTEGALARFAPERFSTFRFLGRELDEHGRATLRYALDDEIEFTERVTLPAPAPLDDDHRERLDGLLALLHWVAGVSYFKTAAPPAVSCEAGAPSPAAADLLEALYSEGLAEFAYTNRLERLPRPSFPRAAAEPRAAEAAPRGASDPARVLVPVGGGKDSIVALEIARRAGLDVGLFSVGDAAPIARTVAVSGLPRLQALRELDPHLIELNRAGALNGHVPVTAIVTCIALLTAAINGYDSVAMANERSASHGNVTWDGVEVNHQFSKGMRAERLLTRALAEIPGAPRAFSLLRPASELAIARAFARMEQYHGAFTSCNAIFRLDPSLRSASWCCDCPKCRFVFLALAPFSDPAHLREVFGADLLDEDSQREGFALLTATGGHKPFECVGEEQESVAALRMLARDDRWREHRVVVALAQDVLARLPDDVGDPDVVLSLARDNDVPDVFSAHADAILGA